MCADTILYIQIPILKSTIFTLLIEQKQAYIYKINKKKKYTIWAKREEMCLKQTLHYYKRLLYITYLLRLLHIRILNATIFALLVE